MNPNRNIFNCSYSIMSRRKQSNPKPLLKSEFSYHKKVQTSCDRSSEFCTTNQFRDSRIKRVSQFCRQMLAHKILKSRNTKQKKETKIHDHVKLVLLILISCACLSFFWLRRVCCFSVHVCRHMKFQCKKKKVRNGRLET